MRGDADQHRATAIQWITTISALILVCIAGYLTGVYEGYKRSWPVPQLRGIFEARFDRSAIRTDAFGRLLRYPGKITIPCPAQDQDTAVLVVFGQSNAANFQGQRYTGLGDRVVNFSEGKCYLASSPLLGADGKYGEPWTLLGNKLVSDHLYTKVILIPAGVGSSSVHQWARGSSLNRMLLTVIREAKQHYTITGLLWHQGATDVAQHTSEEAYKSDLMSLIDSLRAEGVTAPFYISRSSLQLSPAWSPDNPIARAQAALLDGKSILAGPNTDRDISALDRYDGLHFSATGQEKFTDAWLKLLRRPAGAEKADEP